MGSLSRPRVWKLAILLTLLLAFVAGQAAVLHGCEFDADFDCADGSHATPHFRSAHGVRAHQSFVKSTAYGVPIRVASVYTVSLSDAGETDELDEVSTDFEHFRRTSFGRAPPAA